jgi:hypothetical protein
MLSLDSIRWQVVQLATQRHRNGVQLRCAPFKLLVSMLRHCQEHEWAVNRRLLTWVSYKEVEQDTGLSPGTIGYARQQLVACGLVAPVDGMHKRGGADPTAVYEIFVRIMPSPGQKAAAEHVSKHRDRSRTANAGRRTRLSVEERAEILDHVLEQLNGHAWRG